MTAHFPPQIITAPRLCCRSLILAQRVCHARAVGMGGARPGSLCDMEMMALANELAKMVRRHLRHDSARSRSPQLRAGAPKIESHRSIHSTVEMILRWWCGPSSRRQTDASGWPIERVVQPEHLPVAKVAADVLIGWHQLVTSAK